ncbi:UNVERIFIED_CONTAM: Retrovirus-related Pol polyprotein from transposon TNT 1-94 [Sesamum radiatum]|uniref:Retrovirus-related Pol polyprotein from transposon TNT 1-94 n=1 Tax=Sesamum radiatum TaxID=300843 RepID=A0AAW2WC83_SESRA
MDNQDNAQIWHARLGHISQDRIKRGGFSYFITFADDDSRYGYVYLMRYKSEAFGRFKEFRLEVENQTGRKIKTLWSDRGGEYLSAEFLDYLKENRILSQWTPPGTPQLNGVSERRNRTLLDMVRSMMSFTKLPLFFWGYALETAAKLLNMAPSKTVAQTPYKIWHDKPASYKYLRVWGSPAYVKRLVGDKLDSRSSLCRFVGYSKETAGYYFYDPSEQKVFVLRNAVFLEKGFPADTRHEELLLEESKEATPQTDAVTSSASIVPTNDIPILRRSTRVSQQPERLVAKGYTQIPGVDFEETYSPVAMAKSIRIMLAIAAWYDYEIWQMDVKTAFLNGFVEEEIYMDQPEGFTSIGEEQKVCHLQRNDVKMLGDTKAWLSTQFSMKDLGEASYILGIKIIRDRSKRMLGMTQTSYVEKVLKRFKMENSKRGFLPVRHGVKLSKKQSPKTDEELRKMFDIPYASAVGSIYIKIILKYLRRTKDTFLVYGGGELILEGYSDASFQSDEDDAQSQSRFVFKLNGGVVAWKSFKQDTTANSTTEAEYIAASEAAKETVWMKNYIQELGVVPSIAEPVVIFCDNNGAIAQVKEPRSHHRSKHILRCYHLLREMVGRGYVRMDRVTSTENMADPLTKLV